MPLEWILASQSQKKCIFSDFGSELQQNRAFSGSRCFLEVAVKLKELQFTFSSLVLPAEIQDSDFWVPLEAIKPCPPLPLKEEMLYQTSGHTAAPVPGPNGPVC